MNNPSECLNRWYRTNYGMLIYAIRVTPSNKGNPVLHADYGIDKYNELVKHPGTIALSQCTDPTEEDYRRLSAFKKLINEMIK